MTGEILAIPRIHSHIYLSRYSAKMPHRVSVLYQNVLRRDLFLLLIWLESGLF